MLKTISIGTHVHVQGQVVRTLDNGNIVVIVGTKQFSGKPVVLSK